MLVLSRKMDESICIGHDIIVKIVKIRGNVVGLGITAPQNVKIMRKELLDREKAAETSGAESRQSMGVGRTWKNNREITIAEKTTDSSSSEANPRLPPQLKFDNSISGSMLPTRSRSSAGEPSSISRYRSALSEAEAVEV